MDFHLRQTPRVVPSKEETARWNTDPHLYDKMVESLAPGLCLPREIFESHLMALVGGIKHNNELENIHVLTLGDIGVGKSDLLINCHEVMPGSKFADGVPANSDRNGLVAGSGRRPDGTIGPYMGLIPMTSGNVVCLDHVNYMKKNTRDGVLECMKDGYASYQTSNRSGSYPCNTTIIAAGAFKDINYNPKHLLIDNLPFDYSFLVPFDLFWIIQAPDDKECERIFNHINSDQDKLSLNPDEMRKLLPTIRDLTTSITDEIKNAIYSLFLNLNDTCRDLYGAVPPWWSMDQYYGLQRMVAAQAKLHLRSVATIDDISNVKRISIASINTWAGIDTASVHNL